jgi:hypothetical protein
MDRTNKTLAMAQVALLGAMALMGAAGDERDIQVDSITVGSGENKVIIAANKSMTGLAVHRGRETVALIGLDGDGEPGLRLSGYARTRGLTVTSPDSFGSVAIASNKQASGVWVQEGPERFAALTAVRAYGPAIEMSSGRPNREGDEFAVSFGQGNFTPTVQILGRDGNLRTIDADRLSPLEGKPRPKSPAGD